MVIVYFDTSLLEYESEPERCIRDSGYSIEYSPGMYSDPDFTAKLYMCGVRFMKGLQEMCIRDRRTFN